MTADKNRRTYFIKFPDAVAVENFQRAIVQEETLGSVRMDFGEALPDVIVHEADDEQTALIQRLAGPEARVIEDFACSPLSAYFAPVPGSDVSEMLKRVNASDDDQDGD